MAYPCFYVDKTVRIIKSKEQELLSVLEAKRSRKNERHKRNFYLFLTHYFVKLLS